MGVSAVDRLNNTGLGVVFAYSDVSIPTQTDLTLTFLDAGAAIVDWVTDLTIPLSAQLIGTLPLNLDEIAGDNQINSAEKAAGFTISGDTGSVSGAAVTVTVGTQDLTTTSSAAAWTVSVPPDAAYISESSVNVTVNATRTGYGAANLVTRTLVVDLTAPQARSYSAPAALKVGEAITPLGPSTTSDSDIAGYNASGLPSGLAIDIATGSISGVPDTASASTRQATVTIADNVGNTVAATITFPVVAKGEQALTGFAYGASQITYNDSVPALTVPSGAVTALEYAAAPATVCSVDGSSGTLTINAVGICTITVSAPANANYNQASATFELTVIEIGTLPLGLDAVAGDNQINSAEKAANGAAPSIWSDGAAVYAVENIGTSARDPMIHKLTLPTAPGAVTGPTNGTEYTFQVRAVNGEGSRSEPNEASTTPVSPTDPGGGGGKERRPLPLLVPSIDYALEVVDNRFMQDPDNPDLQHNIPDLEVTFADGRVIPADFLSHYRRTGGITRWGHPTSEILILEDGTLTQFYQRGAADFHNVGGGWVVERRLAWDYVGGGHDGSEDQGTEPEITNPHPGALEGPWGHKLSDYAIDGTEIGFAEFFYRFGGTEAFGFPKTDARRDTGAPGTLHAPGTTLGFIRQYFQAGILEYHPEDPAAKVKLTLLGDTLRGILVPDFAEHAPFGMAEPVVQEAVYEPYAVPAGTASTLPADSTPTGAGAGTDPAEIGTLPLGLDEIAGDNQINSAEKAAGFTISGDTGSVSGAAVTVTVGTQDLTTTSSAAAWTVSVPPDAAYISESSVNVTVNATRTGYGAANLVTRTLVVDLTAPQARSYSAPAALKVGEAITPLGPSTTSDSDIAGYNASGLPSGLAIDIATGSISGVPDTASASTRQATVTIADNVGNTVAATITFPVVAKGEQTLTGFAYGASQITYNDSVPALTVPSGAVTALEYAAAPATVCSVDGSSGTLTINAVGICTITVSAPANANYNQASATFELTVIESTSGTLPLGLDEIAGDNQINSAEKAAGFTISGDTGSVSGAAVTVTVGTQDLTTTSSAAAWTVSVPADAAYISESSVTVTVNASKTGYGDANLVTRTLVVDLTAPQARSYSAPAALKVGEAITPLGPSTTSDSDIAGYNASGLPSGLAIDIATGSISGVPDTASASTRQATVTIADNVGNTVAATITFPVVAKGEQTLTGFAYGASQITYNDSVPALTVPSGAVTALEYTAAPATVCSVDGSSGTLTINAVGICTITVSAPANANYNQASATFELTVIESTSGTLPLGLDEIAGDNQINSAEKAAGFTISGDTGSVSGAAVTVTVGTQDLTTTSSAAAWTVSVPADAAYISESSVNVTVNATRTGYGAANLVTRTLVVDLTAPQARSYSAPAALKVGEAITPLGPSTTSDSDIAGYNASGLPSGLAIDIATGSISGVPDTASASTRQATVTIADNVGNTVAATITFPVVAKGEQALTGFAYGASQITYNDSVPALTVPSGAVTALEYAAAPATVCSVDGSSGTLTINAVGICTITVSAPANANYNQASATFELTVVASGTLPLNLDEIAGDNQINSAEKAAGFTISGDTGSVSGAAVTVTVGTQDLTTTSSAAAWTVSVPADAAYISESSVNVTVNATRTGYGAANLVTRTLVVDLTAPQARSYSAPAALKVGEAITPLGPSTTSDSDIAGYNASGLPSGLAIDIATGSISGVPDTASASTRQATVTIADNVGNTVAATITFPVVAKGEQTLTGFAYGASQITYNDSVPALTVPSGAVTALEYTAAPATVCSVDGSSGTLTINAVGICTITVSAPANANYNQASATFELTVIEIGTLPLGLDEIAGDNQINSAEKAAGFTISGDTGSVSGAAVTVTVGTQDLTTTSSAAAWTVSVPADAAYISESSVNVTVNATRTGYGAANLVTRTLVVDLTAPQARSYSAPAALKVGEAITPLGPSTTSDSDIAGYNASGLPSGLAIDIATGSISGVPDTASASTRQATVTIADNVGNTVAATITFPVVAKGEQALTGFAYGASQITYNDSVPALTVPSGAVTALEYAAAPATVCSVDGSSGTLTINAVGICTITVSGAGQRQLQPGQRDL